MRLLLDTQSWLWMQVAPEKLSPRATGLIRDVENDLLFSAASAWEIAIKFSLGKLSLPDKPEEYVPSRMESSGVTALPVLHSHALRVADLPEHHRDPFDRILIAQAQLERAQILTSDRQFASYDIEVIWVA